MTSWRAQCALGCTYEQVAGVKRPKVCDCGTVFVSDKAQSLSTSPSKKQGLKRTQRRESAAERKAREHFNETVKAWPCWFRTERTCELCRSWVDARRVFCPACNGDGRHHCEGPKDAHHLVPKQFLRQRLAALMPEDEFLAILFNPKIGAPICRKSHQAIENGFDRIYWQDLTEEAIEYVSGLPDCVLIRLELECPKRDGVKA